MNITELSILIIVFIVLCLMIKHWYYCQFGKKHLHYDDNGSYTGYSKTYKKGSAGELRFHKKLEKMQSKGLINEYGEYLPQKRK